jgi:hypothetical protein
MRAFARSRQDDDRSIGRGTHRLQRLGELLYPGYMHSLWTTTTTTTTRSGGPVFVRVQ